MRHHRNADIGRTQRGGDFPAKVEEGIGDDRDRRNARFLQLDRIMETP
jgi:hypothetical protein